MSVEATPVIENGEIGIIAGLMGSITGFFLGSSLGSQKKDAALIK